MLIFLRAVIVGSAGAGISARAALKVGRLRNRIGIADHVAIGRATGIRVAGLTGRVAALKRMI